MKAYLGIDVGSISTKGVVIDSKNAIECKVREEHLISTAPQQLNTFISFGYKLKL